MQSAPETINCFICRFLHHCIAILSQTYDQLKQQASVAFLIEREREREMAFMCCYQLQHPNQMTVEELKAWLRSFDGDQDGRTSREELKEALQSLRIWFGGWKARRVMKEADMDCSGYLDNDNEIAKLVTYAQQKLHMKIYQN